MTVRPTDDDVEPGRRRRFVRSLRIVVPLVLLTTIAFVLTWLNQSPWWGRAIVATELVVLAATVRWWAPGQRGDPGRRVVARRAARGRDRGARRPGTARPRRRRPRPLAQIVEVPLEGTLVNPFPVSERSLSLNIWRGSAPAAEQLPVLVYIPGGCFSTGSNRGH